MGHDIKLLHRGQPIAHLRISGVRRRSTKFYQSLMADEYNGGDSGTNETATFGKAGIMEALTELELTSDEKDFLKKCLQHASATNGQATILFQ